MAAAKQRKKKARSMQVASAPTRTRNFARPPPEQVQAYVLTLARLMNLSDFHITYCPNELPDNPKTERAAIQVDAGEVGYLYLTDRAFRETATEQRRIFCHELGHFKAHRFGMPALMRFKDRLRGGLVDHFEEVVEAYDEEVAEGIARLVDVYLPLPPWCVPPS